MYNIYYMKIIKMQVIIYPNAMYLNALQMHTDMLFKCDSLFTVTRVSISIIITGNIFFIYIS